MIPTQKYNKVRLSVHKKTILPIQAKIHAEFYPKTRREFFKTRRVLKNSYGEFSENAV